MSCFTSFPPPQQRALAAALAVRENPRNGVGRIQPKSRWDSRDLAVLVGKTWQSARELNVNFLGDNWNTDMMHKIEKYARSWAAYANIKFRFTLHKQSDIRIELGTDGKDWSKIGTDAQLVTDWQQPTMHFGTIDLKTDEAQVKYVVTHQFGHALGCIHEFQSPNIEIKWDEDTVYDYFSQRGWTNLETLENIMKQYPTAGTDVTAFDKNSIMMMKIPKEWTRDGFSAEQPKELSDNDMIKIREMYQGDLLQRPLDSDPDTNGALVKCAPRANKGEFYSADKSYFNTLELDDGKGDLKWAWVYIDCSNMNYEQPPNVAIGLNRLDFGYKHNMRIDATVEQNTSAGFRIQMATWSTSTWYSAACSWLKFAQNDPVFRCGSAEIGSLKAGQTAYRYMTFDRPFDAPPKVVVWINKLDMNSDHNYRIKVGADNITRYGCRLTFDTWSTTILYSCRVTYVAIRADTAGIAGGIYCTTNDWHHPQRTYTGTEEFDHSVFLRDPPRTVLLGFNELDLFSDPANSRINTRWDSLTNREFNWTIETWADSTVYAAGVSYIVS